MYFFKEITFEYTHFKKENPFFVFKKILYLNNSKTNGKNYQLLILRKHVLRKKAL